MATVGAALKKIVIAILTNPKALKKVGMVILIILLVIFMPVIAIVSLLSGGMDIDTQSLQSQITQVAQQENDERIQLINETMTKVEEELKMKKLSSYNTQAEVIYVFALSDKSKEKDFVKNFVSCFKKDISDDDLVKAVNKKFGTDLKYDDFSKVMQMVSSTKISVSDYYDASKKNNLDLVQWCKDAYKNGWGYVYGGYGQVCTVQYLNQQASLYPGSNEAGGPMRTVGEQWLGRRVVDCIGLIKSYAWYNPSDGSINSGANGFTDCGANSIWSNVKESGDISTIPEIPGVAVWMNGHIGVYIGNGEVIEAQGTAYGVVKTQLKNRGWSKWLKIPNIEYVNPDTKKDSNSKTDNKNNSKKN
ncbi:NlpC/P60 family protein [Ruminococcus sp. zg-924]|uniref:NlpC/P60 family protein n=1 Tax=Ruminococcus sp. zg-924 TaxID=2678505 RepID=UPI00210B9657|nr:NlpC/P60 family protein [Ruminococcus sp. zg-924]MCQ4022846.1 hypothetical protein [Ruminococcus sp. zg-924]